MFHFNVLELGETRADFNGSVSLTLNKWLEKQNSCLYDFAVTVENVGKSTQKLDHIVYTVCELAPPVKMATNQQISEISGTCAKPPTVVTMNPDFIMGQTGKVYPGEKKSTVYSFIVPEEKWPWQVEATGYADREGKRILFRGSDWQFCGRPGVLENKLKP